MGRRGAAVGAATPASPAATETRTERPSAEAPGSDPRGLLFDVQRFSIHDGAGIRTTAFLKGCPLSCSWCQNPEGIPFKRLLWYHPERCIRCERCVKTCPPGALTAHPERERFIEVDQSRCSDDCRCVEVCPSGALEWDSRWYGAGELVQLFCRDRAFYDSSGGGITLSGGEPLRQLEFTIAVLRESRAAGLSTAVESTLFASPEHVRRVAPFVDCFLTDIKLLDSAEHAAHTGVPNERILSNIELLSEAGAKLTIRIPLIPEATAREDNVRSIARYVRSLPGDHDVELMNFNPLPVGKYAALGKTWAFSAHNAPFDAETVEHFAAIVREEGVSLAGEEHS